jgi:hypothetical protein
VQFRICLLTPVSGLLQYEFDNDEIYCSELVFRAFLESTGEQLGEVVSLGELRWSKYEGLIREMIGGELPLERTPWHLSRARRLELIYRSGTGPQPHTRHISVAARGERMLRCVKRR